MTQIRDRNPGLSHELVKRVITKLGLDYPMTTDLPALQKLYASWSCQLPFENIWKLMSLLSNEKKPLPGMDAGIFFENWLEYGSGATCWPMANAFCELLNALGYRACRIAGHMRDLPVLNHGSVLVDINGSNYLAEASLLIHQVIPINNDTLIHDDPVFPFEWEPSGNDHLLWLQSPPSGEFYFCRLKMNPMTFEEFEERYEASRSQSIFNQRVYAKRNYPGKMVVIWGNTKFVKTSEGIEAIELDEDQLCISLQDEIGISSSLISSWTSSGAMNASFEKHGDSKPPAEILRPPSQRGNPGMASVE